MYTTLTHIIALAEVLQKEIGALATQSMELTRLEMQEIRCAIVRYSVYVLLGALVLAGGVLLLAAALVGYLNTFMPFWAAALWVGVPLFLVGGVMALVAARRLSSQPLLPEQSMESMAVSARRMRDRIKLAEKDLAAAAEREDDHGIR